MFVDDPAWMQLVLLVRRTVKIRFDSTSSEENNEENPMCGRLY